jgi:hypothetical protein
MRDNDKWRIVVKGDGSQSSVLLRKARGLEQVSANSSEQKRQGQGDTGRCEKVIFRSSKSRVPHLGRDEEGPETSSGDYLLMHMVFC